MKWLERLFSRASKATSIPQTQKLLASEAVSNSPNILDKSEQDKNTEQKSDNIEQKKSTKQEIVLRDPREIMKPWKMDIPLNMNRFHFEDLKLEDLELEDLDPEEFNEDPKSTLIRDLNFSLQNSFSSYHVSLLPSINENTFATYTIREPRGNAFICSLTLTLTDSTMLTVAVDLPHNARRESYEFICDRARGILIMLYRLYGERKQEQPIDDTPSIEESHEIARVEATPRKKGGRPAYGANRWAYTEVNEHKRPRADVRPEWEQRLRQEIGDDHFELLANPNDSFNQAIRLKKSND